MGASIRGTRQTVPPSAPPQTTPGRDHVEEMHADRSAYLNLERKFEQYIRLDVTPQLPGEQRSGAEEVCARLSERLMTGFDPVWDQVQPNPCGTLGHHSQYLTAKTDWLTAELTHSDDVQRLKTVCQKHLPGFWVEWAGDHLAA